MNNEQTRRVKWRSVLKMQNANIPEGNFSALRHPELVISVAYLTEISCSEEIKF